MLGISQEELARLLRVSTRTVSRWESGFTIVDGDVRGRLTRLKRIIDDRLKLGDEPRTIMNWLQTPTSVTVRCAPLELLSMPEHMLEATRIAEQTNQPIDDDRTVKTPLRSS